MAEDNLRFTISVPRPRFSIAALLCLMAFCVVFLAWYLDHQKLKNQIPAQASKTSVLFRLQNASSDVVATELQKLFPSATFVSEGGTNSVIASFEQNRAELIRLVVRHMDRAGSEYVTSNSDPETKQLLPPQILEAEGKGIK